MKLEDGVAGTVCGALVLSLLLLGDARQPPAEETAGDARALEHLVPRQCRPAGREPLPR